MTAYSIIQKSKLEGAHRIDAEYYQPEYLEIIKKLNSLNSIPIKEVVKNPKRKFKPKQNETFRYIEISEVDLNTGEYTESEILGENAPDRAQWIVKQNDVIISTVRPIRNAVSLIKGNAKNLVCSSGFAVLTPDKVLPQYLFIYLKIRPIIKLLDRYTTATMYPAITSYDVLNTMIYPISRTFQNKISQIVDKAIILLDNSKSLYSKAENLLLKELGLKDFEVEDDLSYVVNLSNVKTANRTDAEYFKPKYKKLIDYLKDKFESKKIEELVTIQKGIEPGSKEYQEEGNPFIRVSNLSKFGINDNNQKYLSDDFYQELRENYQPKLGEILLTKDASPGMAYVVKETIEGIISSGILRLKRKENLEPEYLALLINSLVGQYQTERDTGGSVIIHWRPEQIKNMVVPIIPKSTQQKISNLVKQSYEARKEAKQLLQEAKEKVEKMILENRN